MTRFRDITYCSSDCMNRDCEKNYSPEKAAAAEAMWGKNPPIDFADLKTGCADYRPPVAVNVASGFARAP